MESSKYPLVLPGGLRTQNENGHKSDAKSKPCHGMRNPNTRRNIRHLKYNRWNNSFKNLCSAVNVNPLFMSTCLHAPHHFIDGIDSLITLPYIYIYKYICICIYLYVHLFIISLYKRLGTIYIYIDEFWNEVRKRCGMGSRTISEQSS